MRVEGRKTLFSALVDCAKGFLTAKDRDQMANLIRPDPAPLPPVTTTAAPVVTTVGGMSLNAVPQLLVTTTPVPLPLMTAAVVVTAAVTPVMATPTVAITTTVTPVTSTVPVNITPQGGVVSSAQQTVTPVGEVTGAIASVMASEVSTVQHDCFLCSPFSIRDFPSKLTELTSGGNFHYPFWEYSPSESPHNHPAFQPKAASRYHNGS